MYGSHSAFRVIDIKGASASQLYFLIATVFSLPSKSFHLVEVRDAGPPVTYGAETKVHGGLCGAHEIIVDGEHCFFFKAKRIFCVISPHFGVGLARVETNDRATPASSSPSSQAAVGLGVFALVLAVVATIAWLVHKPSKARESRPNKSD